MPNARRMSAAIVTMAVALVLLPFMAHAAQHAARVVYAFGQVQAVGGSGKARPLSRGDAIVPGDTVVTRRGRAQLRFTDGGFAAMQPNTEYRVDDYAFKGEADGSERSFLSLVRGSVRLVTGIIGRANKQNYRIRTSVATIGIRGTSGRLSHCESNCGERGPGTKLQGYGGTWDLSSGSFTGPVEAKQAKFCNGVSCFDLPGFGQREDVPPEEELDENFGEDEEDVAGDGYQQGDQSGSDGTQCDLGGGCGDIVVATGLVGADAFREALGGDTGTIDNLTIVTKNGRPVGGITVAGPNAEPGDGDIEILTRDIGAFRTAFSAVGDPQIAALGNAILNAVPPEQIALLNSMPAVIGEGDFGRTNDGLLVKGRFTRGFLLEVSVFLNGTPEVFSELIRLTNFQSDHFIFGPDPLFVPFAGQANYTFTGGTFSTAVDGSSIGLGATAGTLSFDFGLLGGQIAMTVKHGLNTFNVLGGLEFDNDPKFFRDNMVVANTMGGSYPVTLDGFFAFPNGVKAPRAAGLSYAIDMPVDLIGTAGFGLNASMVPAVIPPPAPQLANGSYLAFAHHFLAGGVTQTTNADDFIIGPADTAFTAAGGTLVTQFNSTTPVDLCAGVACTFNAATANAVLDANGPGATTTNAALGVRWNRWDPNHVVNHNQAPTPSGPFHILVADVPTALGAVPGIGSGLQGQYNLLVGGSTATVVYENNGILKGNVAPFVDVAWTLATMNIIFDIGTVSANFAGNFPAFAPVGSFTLAGGGPFSSLMATHALPLAGTVTSAAVSAGGGTPNCGGPCVISGHTHFDVLGVGATAVGGSIEASTSGPAPKFGMAGTYLLQGSVVAFP